MIRVVSLKKAAASGIAGALGWEMVLRGLQAAGLPLFDIVQHLGRLVFPHGPQLAWWMAGIVAHALTGALWAIFYAYFFWSLFHWRPLLQGLAFSLIPAILALFLIHPQLSLMLASAEVARVDPAEIFAGLTWPEAGGLLLGHLIYGAVLGALYTHPVGYNAADAAELISSPPRHSNRPQARRHDGPRGFIFATGIECSYPTIENGRWRRDQMYAAGHYRLWRTDFELAREIGVTHLRYGPPLHLVYTAPRVYDWDFTDDAFAELHDHGPEPIVDLCHFGVPSWLENFQNPELPQALSEYAAAFAKRYPWVRFYTPVNEMFVCAKLSTLHGAWNEQRRDERAFVTAVRHMARAGVLMADAILRVRPDAIFVNSESSEFYQPCCPDPKIVRIAAFENERRFLPLDLLYARPVSDGMRAYLREQGMPEEEYAWFMSQTVPRRSILGVDYYEWNELLIDSEGRARSLGELFGWYVIASQYYERYKRPMMHTETNRLDARDAPRWLWRQWHNVQLLRNAGVPLVGFTWYSLTDQVDWGIALTEPLGTVDPVGLFDLNRDPRPVGLAYRHLIDLHRNEQGFSECPPLAELMG